MSDRAPDSSWWQALSPSGLYESISTSSSEDKSKLVKYVLIGGASVAVGYALVNGIHGWLAYRELENRRIKRRQEVGASLKALKAQLAGIDQDAVKSLTSKSFAEVRELLDKKQITSVELLKAYQYRALQSHEVTNCLIEDVREAEDDARAKDRSMDDEERGMLHGIPVSIKDDYPIKGYNASLGFSIRLGEVEPDDCAFLKALRKQGAVPFVRTNIPQAELSGTSGNPIYGLVHNAHKKNRSPGGSSSGEGALVGHGGSLLGFGSDIAGSVRIPCHFNGICGIKPSSTRIGHKGMSDIYDEDDLMAVVSRGPMARDVDTVVLAMRALWTDNNLHHFDPRALPIPFQEQVYGSKKRLRIGYYISNGTVEPEPATVRAMNMAKKHLEDAGHELVPWKIPDLNAVVELMWNTINTDGGDHLYEALKHDKIDPSIELMYHVISMPRILRRLMAKISALFIRPPAYADFWQYSCGLRTANELAALKGKIEKFKLLVGDDWREHELDAVICPTLPIPAPPVLDSTILVLGVLYTFVYNVLDYPAGIVPMTKVTSQDLNNMKSYTDKDEIHRLVPEVMKDAEGLPVCVQVVGLHACDEMVLRVMKEVEGARDY